MRKKVLFILIILIVAIFIIISLIHSFKVNKNNEQTTNKAQIYNAKLNVAENNMAIGINNELIGTNNIENNLDNNVSIEVVKYTGNEIKIDCVINKMPISIDDRESLPQNYGQYLYIEFEQNFLNQNDILSIDYLIEEGKYKTYKISNIENNMIKIDQVYYNEQNITDVIILVKEKQSQKIKKYKLSETASILY